MDNLTPRKSMRIKQKEEQQENLDFTPKLALIFQQNLPIEKRSLRLNKSQEVLTPNKKNHPNDNQTTKASGKRKIPNDEAILTPVGTDYFQIVSTKVTKSDNTLKNLDLSTIQNFDKKCLENDEVKKTVINYYENFLFSKIYSLLIENFNVILYGLGSKKSLLDAFKDKWLLDEKFLKIYGFFVELNLKIILIKLGKLFDLETTNEQDFYKKAICLEDDIYLIIHSMDVLFKLDPKIKNFFVNLYVKSNGKLHIIASVDHVNAALMFDLKDQQKLNLVCLEATTYESFHLERGYLNSANLKKKNKGLLDLDEQALTINGILNVYNSLPENSKKFLILIFKEWLEYQEFKKSMRKVINDHQDDDESKGLDYQKIFQKSREAFLVTSGPTFKQRLGEITDHNLIKTIKSKGSDYIAVLLQEHIIQKVLNEIENP